jgi:glycine betaine/proline transport system permease protein
MDWFFNFPDMSRSDLREFKKTVDFAFTDFSRTYGESIEVFFEPLLMFLVSFESFL